MDDWHDYSVSGSFERAVNEFEKVLVPLIEGAAASAAAADSETLIEPEGSSHGVRLSLVSRCGADACFSSLEAQQAFLLGLKNKPFLHLSHERDDDDAFGSVGKREARWLTGAAHCALSHSRVLLRQHASLAGVPSAVVCQLFEPSRGASIGVETRDGDLGGDASARLFVRSKCDALQPHESGGPQARTVGGSSGALANERGEADGSSSGLDLVRARNVERLFVFKLLQQRRDYAMRLPPAVRQSDSQIRIWLRSRPQLTAEASYFWLVPLNLIYSASSPLPSAAPRTSSTSATSSWWPSIGGSIQPHGAAPAFNFRHQVAMEMESLWQGAGVAPPFRLPVRSMLLRSDLKSGASTSRLLTRHSDDALSFADAAGRDLDAATASFFWSPGSSVRRSNLLLSSSFAPFDHAHASTTTPWAAFREADLGQYPLAPVNGSACSPPSLAPLALFEACVGALQSFEEDLAEAEQELSLNASTSLETLSEGLDAVLAWFASTRDERKSRSASPVAAAAKDSPAALPRSVRQTPVSSPQATKFLPAALAEKTEAAKALLDQCGKVQELCERAVASTQQMLAGHSMQEVGRAARSEVPGLSTAEEARPYPSLSAAVEAVCGIVNPTQRWFGLIPSAQGSWLKDNVSLSFSTLPAAGAASSDGLLPSLTSCRPVSSLLASSLSIVEVEGRTEPIWKLWRMCDEAVQRQYTAGGSGPGQEEEREPPSQERPASLQQVWQRAKKTTQSLRRILDLPPSAESSVNASFQAIAGSAASSLRASILSFKPVGDRSLASDASEAIARFFLPVLRGNRSFSSLVRLAHAEVLDIEAVAAGGASSGEGPPLPVASLLMRQCLATFVAAAWSCVVDALRRLWDQDFLEAQEALSIASSHRRTGPGVAALSPLERALALGFPVPPFYLQLGEATDFEEAFQALACSWQGLEAQKLQAQARAEENTAVASPDDSFASSARSMATDGDGVDESEEAWFDPDSDVEEERVKSQASVSSPTSPPQIAKVRVEGQEEASDQLEPLPFSSWGRVLSMLQAVILKRDGQVPDASSSILSPASLRSALQRVSFTVEAASLPPSVASVLQKLLTGEADDGGTAHLPPLLLPRPPRTSAQIASDDRGLRERFGCQHEASGLRVREEVEALRPRYSPASDHDHHGSSGPGSLVVEDAHPSIDVLRGDMRAFALYSCDKLFAAQPPAGGAGTPAPGIAETIEPRDHLESPAFLLDFFGWYYRGLHSRSKAGAVSYAPIARYGLQLPQALGDLTLSLVADRASGRVVSFSLSLPANVLAQHAESAFLASELPLARLFGGIWATHQHLSLWAEQASSALSFTSALRGKAEHDPEITPSLLRQALHSSTWKPAATGEVALEALQQFDCAHLFQSLLAATVEKGAVDAWNLTKAASGGIKTASLPELASSTDLVASLALDAAPSVASLPLRNSIDHLRRDVRGQRLEGAERALRTLRHTVSSLAALLSEDHGIRSSSQRPFASPVLRGRRVEGETTHASVSLEALISRIKLSASSCLQALEACLVTAVAAQQRQLHALYQPAQVQASQTPLATAPVQASPLSSSLGDPLAFSSRSASFERASVLGVIAAVSDCHTAAARRLSVLAMIRAGRVAQPLSPSSPATSAPTLSALGAEGCDRFSSSSQLDDAISSGKVQVPWHPGWLSTSRVVAAAPELIVIEPRNPFSGGAGSSVAPPAQSEPAALKGGRKRDAARRLAEKALHRLGAVTPAPAPQQEDDDEDSLDGTEVGSIDDDANEAEAEWEDESTAAKRLAPIPLQELSTDAPSTLSGIASMHKEAGKFRLTSRALPANEDVELFRVTQVDDGGEGEDWEEAWEERVGDGKKESARFRPPIVSSGIGDSFLAPLRSRKAAEALQLVLDGQAIFPMATQTTADVLACREMKEHAMASPLTEEELVLKEALIGLGAGSDEADVSSPLQFGISPDRNGKTDAAKAFRASQRLSITELVRLYCCPRSPAPSSLKPAASAEAVTVAAVAPRASLTGLSRYPPLEMTVLSSRGPAPSVWAPVFCGAWTNRSLRQCADDLAPSPLVRLWRFESDDGPSCSFADNCGASAAALSEGVAIDAGSAWERKDKLKSEAAAHSMTSLCSGTGVLALGQSFASWR